MIRVIAIALWICGITLASTWVGATYLGGSHATAEKAGGGDGHPMAGLQSLKPRPVSVPMIVDGAIQGYVMAQLTFTVNKDMLSKLAVQPENFVVDETFKTIYTGEQIDFKRLKKQDIAAMAKSIKDNVNKRFGGAFVEDVLFEDLNYVPMEKVRGGKDK